MTPPRRGRPTDRSKAETRASILTAGRECFGTYGYDAATNRMVADAAGVSPGAIYQHFRAKRDLYRAVADDSRQLIVEAFTSATRSSRDVRSAMLATLDISRRLHQQDTSFARFTVAYPVEVRRHSELADLPVDFVSPRELRSILYRAGLREAVTDGVSPNEASTALYLLLMGLARLAQAVRDTEEYLSAEKVCELLFVHDESRGHTSRDPMRATARHGALRPPVARGTRDRLIAAAVACFAVRGYASTTLSDIAQRAGLTTGAVYGHFSSKSDLFVAAVQQTASVVEAPLLASTTENADVSARVDAYIDAMIELSTGMPTVLAFRSIVPVELVRSAELSAALGDEYGARLAFCRQLLEGATVKDTVVGRDDLARLLSIVGDSMGWYSAIHRSARIPATALKLLLHRDLIAP